MALFNFGKKKEEEKKTPACACSCGCAASDMQKVMEYGVMSMPALVVNEKVVAMGKVLKAADVVALLHKLGF